MGLKPVDLNCDLGEGEPEELTEALCRHVTSINVACGGHAGNEATMRRCIALAAQHHLRFGAHPGLSGNFGRGPVGLASAELAKLIVGQVTRLREQLDAHEAEGGARVRLCHVKLHGSLYHHAEQRPDVASAFAMILADRFPGVAAVSLPGRAVEAACRHSGVPFLAEGFLDRAYRSDGSLVPRGEPGAIVDSPALVLHRLKQWSHTGEIISIDGEAIRLPVQTWCLHSDTPGILELARSVATETSHDRPGER